MVHSVTWANCPINKQYALNGRQGGNRAQPDPQVLKDFQIFAKRRVGQLASQSLPYIMKMDLSLDEYMSRFPKAKRDVYMKGYLEAVDK